MKKYLEDLKQELLKKKLTNKEIEEILTDHEEMIQNAMDEGLSEDEIKAKFGKPEQLAEELADFEQKEDTEQQKTDSFTLYESFEVNEDEISVNVKLTSEDIVYQVSSDSKINVYYKGKGKIDKYTVGFKHGKFELLGQKNVNLVFSFSKGNDLDFIVELPEAVRVTELAHQGVSSDVVLKNLDIMSFKLTTTSGDMMVENAKLGAAFWHTVSGDLFIKDTAMEKLDSSQVSGDIKLERVKIAGDVVCNSVSGDLLCTDSSCKDFTLKTVSGDLDGKEFYPKSVSLKSVSGDIKIRNKEKTYIKVLTKHSLSGDIDIN